MLSNQTRDYQLRQREQAGAPAMGDSRNPLDSQALESLLNRIFAELREIRQSLSGARKSHYTVDEVARMVGRSAYTVRRWITEKRISATRVDGTGPKGKLLVQCDQLAKLINLGQGEDIPDAVVSN